MTVRGFKLASVVAIAATTASCTSTAVPNVHSSNTQSITSSNAKSQIVAAMPNRYQERPELPIDPCQDIFIATMESLGYTLADGVVPNTDDADGFWFTACPYRSDNTRVNISATSTERLADLVGDVSADGLVDYETQINGRFAVVSPLRDSSRSCWIGMRTSFGAINVAGGARGSLKSDGRDACADMTKLLEQLEPLLGD